MNDTPEKNSGFVLNQSVANWLITGLLVLVAVLCTITITERGTTEPSEESKAAQDAADLKIQAVREVINDFKVFMHSYIPRWQYIAGTVEDDNFSEEINKIGEQGWELVYARRANAGSNEYPRFCYECIFKRKLVN